MNTLLLLKLDNFATKEFGPKPSLLLGYSFENSVRM